MTPPHPELGPLEMEVLGLLDQGDPVAVGAVRDRLEKAGRPLAYTTVMTVLGRLFDKGLVTRTKEGTRYLYAPARKANGVAQGILARIQQRLFRSDKARPIMALLDDEGLSTEELEAMRQLIDEKLRGRS